MTQKVGHIQVDSLVDASGNFLSLPIVTATSVLVNYTHAAGTVPSIDFPNLDNNAAGGYEIIVMGVAGAFQTYFGLQVQGDTTALNYYTSLFTHADYSIFQNLANGGPYQFRARFNIAHPSAGKRENSWYVECVNDSTYKNGIIWYTPDLANITRLTLRGDANNAITNGTRVIISKTIF